MRHLQTADLQTGAWVSQTRTSVSQTSASYRYRYIGIGIGIGIDRGIGNRGYYMAARRYEIYLRVLKNISRVSAANE